MKALSGSKGYRRPDLKDSLVEASGRASLRPSQLQVISLCAVDKWSRRSVDSRHASLQKGNFQREVYLRAPIEWKSPGRQGIRELRALAYGWDDAPVASYKAPRRHVRRDKESPNCVSLEFEASTYVPC